MTCQTLLGRTVQPKDSVGGLKTIYIADFGLQTYLGDNEIVTDIKNSSGGTPVFYRYEVRESVSNFEEEENFDQKIGMGNFEQDIQMRFLSLDNETNYEVKKMVGRRFQAVVHDNTGKAWICGKDNGLKATSGNSQVGSSKGDFVGYDLTLNGIEQSLANYLTGSTVDDPFAGIGTDPIIIPGSDIATDVYCFISNIVQTFDGKYLEEGYGYINNDYFNMSGDDLICTADNAVNFYVDQQTGQLVELA